MWDDVNSLRRVIRILSGLSLLLVCAGAVGVALRQPAFALRAVQLDAAPQRIDQKQLEAAVRDSLHGNFFTVNLDQSRQTFEKLPWVRRVSVRRHFPWQLDVALEEHVALARWNGTALVNTEGEVFSANDADVLPEFTGPEGAAQEMAQRYARFSEMLAPLGLSVAQVNVSSRYAWQLRLNEGVVLELGREQIEERLERFAAAYPQYVAAMKAPAKYVDLRYRNGFAARQSTS